MTKEQSVISTDDFMFSLAFIKGMMTEIYERSTPVEEIGHASKFSDQTIPNVLNLDDEVGK